MLSEITTTIWKSVYNSNLLALFDLLMLIVRVCSFLSLPLFPKLFLVKLFV